MALSDIRILEEIKKGNIIIDPFNQEDLSTSSYDLRLGEWFYREQRPNRNNPNSRATFFNPYNEAGVKLVWGNVEQAKSLEESVQPDLIKGWQDTDEGITLQDKVIILHPGETILAHTQEFIGGLRNFTTSMQTRSSHGRSFIGVCKCAGWGDVGYVNRWTMEITNFSRYYTTPLIVGRRYAQMVFSETGKILDKNYGEVGKYQLGSSIEEIKKTWKPEMMLPKLHLDRDRKI